jgi:hypothetical protein
VYTFIVVDVLPCGVQRERETEKESNGITLLSVATLCLPTAEITVGGRERLSRTEQI